MSPKEERFFGAILIILVMWGVSALYGEYVKKDIKKQHRNENVVIEYKEVEGGYLNVVHSIFCPNIKYEDYIDYEDIDCCIESDESECIIPKLRYKRGANYVYDGCISRMEVNILNAISHYNMIREERDEQKFGIDGAEFEFDFGEKEIDSTDMAYTGYYVYGHFGEGKSRNKKLSKPFNTIEHYNWGSKDKREYIYAVGSCSLEEWITEE